MPLRKSEIKNTHKILPIRLTSWNAKSQPAKGYVEAYFIILLHTAIILQTQNP